MTSRDDQGLEVFRRLQALARSTASRNGRPVATEEVLTRHVLESFLDRLVRSQHSHDFVLKGGMALSAYDVRRATKDIDVNAISADVTPAHLKGVVRDIVSPDGDDGVHFDLTSLEIQDIRDSAEYPGLRLRISAHVAHWRTTAIWDVSTGDPVVPVPRLLQIHRVLGNPFSIRGYAPETMLAEKGVTILERGTASTRWRDYLDIVQLARQGFDSEALLGAARAVAAHRGVTLAPIAQTVVGYGAVAQPKWAAWRRSQGFEHLCAEILDDQLAEVAAVLDPVFIRASA